ncbi:MAG: hypothetical protein LBF57_01980 [Holosporaceae bacterium]|jgi:hypothetical protein|nr:hypothetical protein [Holosporaceae bacterium]
MEYNKYVKRKIKGNIMPPEPITLLKNASQALNDINESNRKNNVANPQVNHVTTGGFRIKLPGQGKQVFEGQIFDDIFVAKASAYRGFGIPVRHNSITSSTPKRHSEVAFLQHLTNTDSRSNYQQTSVLKTALQRAQQEASKNDLRLKQEPYEARVSRTVP